MLNNLTIQKIRTFIKSLWWHIWAGFPKATKEQIQQRFNVCVLCDMYDKNNQQCLVCGCNINNKKIFLNKLAWADQKCPINKWDKLV